MSNRDRIGLFLLCATWSLLHLCHATSDEPRTQRPAVDLVKKAYGVYLRADPFVPLDWYCSPSGALEDWEPKDGLGYAELLFREALKLNPRDYRAMLGLARTHLRFGAYEDANRLCEEAVEAAPGDETARELLNRAHHLLSLEPEVKAAGPKGANLLRYVAGCFTRPARPQIAAVYSRPDWRRPWAPGWWPLREAALVIFDERGDDLKRTWSSGNMVTLGRGASGREGRECQPDWDDCVMLRAQDVTGDGVDDLVVALSAPGGSVIHLRLCVFSLSHSGLRRIFARDLTTNADLMPLLQDIDGDGKREVTFYYEIWGETLCHAECPHWHDIYVYRNGKYVLDNWAFPHTYDKLYPELRALLKEHPTDAILWDYFARTCDLVGVPNEAKAARAKAKELRTSKGRNDDG